MTEAFFFGPEGEQIFATYHPPANYRATDQLTVICGPLLSEYMRTQLAVRELSIALADTGHHVIRFDYRGTGDSQGSFRDMRAEDWFEDVAAAINEGIDISGAVAVNVLGIRAGSLMAIRAAGRRGGIRKIVLWDPVVDGADYVRSMRAIHSRVVARNRYMSKKDKGLALAEFDLRSGASDIYRDLDKLDVSSELANLAVQPAVILTTNVPAPMLDKACFLPVPFDCNWLTDSEDIMLPRPVLEKIRESLVMP